MPPPPSPDPAVALRPDGRLRWMMVAWPAFLAACVLEMLVFALVDPSQLRWFGGKPIELSPTAVYSLAFFVFWGVICLAGGTTQLLQRGADEVNRDEAASARAPGHAP